jgi:hypothetical protein
MPLPKASRCQRNEDSTRGKHVRTHTKRVTIIRLEVAPKDTKR